MKYISEIANLIAGKPLQRISEGDSQNTITYKIYSQREHMKDLYESEKDYTSDTISTSDEMVVVHTGDIVISLLSGTAAVVRDIHDEYALSHHFLRVSLQDKNIDSKYFMYWFNESSDAKKQKLELGQTNQTFTRYTKLQVEQTRVENIPKIKEQETIGNIYVKQLKLNELRNNVAQLHEKRVLYILKELG